MTDETLAQTIFDKKYDSYGHKEENFVAGGEITVTITLGEYRKLVQDCATADTRIEKAEDDKYRRNAENDALKKENAELKAEMYELKKKLDSAVEDDGEKEEGETF